ncbi:polysaccharide deacetylase family protein [Natrialbaceae archaeon AArc-T1-2]|uniref:polysaccharide deacetylase family protein n=1 Tax=Natrialbaceae archaeon AArc-T1-2 TaxID=3053904 RepID=UPI00255AA8F4|nr:polysaccharide deacetylase family protein [Natrialbaceae archaeon AArc-T1-2]WIV67433.1 polysaccharide deacetylase family protein [Natrialbaceae archaeon AArc-T1-2]
MSQEPSRRRFIGAAGAGTIGTTVTVGCLRGSTDDETSGDPNGEGESDGDDAGDADDAVDEDDVDDPPAGEEDDAPSIDGGAIVFVYDDGPIEDYDAAFPVHQEFDAPASAGIVTEWMGREDYNGTDWMGVEELEELAAAGWEITSHTTAHTALGEFELVADAGPDDVRVYPEQRNHGFHHGHEIEVTDGEKSVRRTVVGSDHDDTGGYLEFDEPLGESFRAGETVERHPEDVMHAFLGESKRELEDLGFEVDTLLAPYDIADEWTIEIAREYYDGIANVRPGSMINDPDTFDPFETRRDYFIEFTSPETVRDELDRVAEEEAIGVVGAHTFKEEVTSDRIRETLEWVDERDLEVLTFRDAIMATAGNG